jgi:hypothetical protein
MAVFLGQGGWNKVGVFAADTPNMTARRIAFNDLHGQTC